VSNTTACFKTDERPKCSKGSPEEVAGSLRVRDAVHQCCGRIVEVHVCQLLWFGKDDLVTRHIYVNITNSLGSKQRVSVSGNKLDVPTDHRDLQSYEKITRQGGAYSMSTFSTVSI
jgi:hypothetical protein